jgi:hypothetical protein
MLVDADRFKPWESRFIVGMSAGVLAEARFKLPRSAVMQSEEEVPFQYTSPWIGRRVLRLLDVLGE